MSAAIPHALLLLYALMDLLPYPAGPRGMWYEIHTGSTETIDELGAAEEFAGIGDIEEDSDMNKRIKVGHKMRRTDAYDSLLSR